MCTDFGGAVDIIDGENAAQSVEDDFGQCRHKLRRRHQNVDAVGPAKTKRNQIFPPVTFIIIIIIIIINIIDFFLSYCLARFVEKNNRKMRRVSGEWEFSRPRLDAMTVMTRRTETII